MALRLAHGSDFHLTEGSRFLDGLRCLDAFVDDVLGQQAHLAAWTGDLSGIPAPHTMTRAERLALIVRARRITDQCPLVILRGNHDAEGDLLVFRHLAAAHPIHVFEEPGVVDVAGARVFAFPYPFKARWLAAHLDLAIEEQHRAIEAELRALLASWRVQVEDARSRRLATIFLGHVAIRDALMAGGERQLPPGEEIELTTGDLVTLGCDYAGNGHVHLRQQLAPGVEIVGSIDRSGFGEETDVKGWIVADLVPGLPAVVHRRHSPTRTYQTLDVTWALDAGNGTPGWVWGTAPDDVAGLELRVRVAIPEEAAATAPVAALEQQLRDAGAYDVTMRRQTIVKQELRCAAVVAAETLADQCVALWDALGAEGPGPEQRARCLAKLPRLDDDAPLAEAA